MTGPSRRLAAAMAAVLLVATVASLLGIGVRAADVGSAAVDEPQYLLSALSLAEDGDLDISDELRDGRADAFHPAPLPVQTAVLDGGRQISPHDPLLPALLAVPTLLGGWVAAKAALAVLAGVLAALTLWTAVVRFAAPVGLTAVVVATAGASFPLAAYGTQVYPELPAALAVTAAVALLTGGLAGGRGRWRTAGLVAVVVALPWLAVKYAPVAAVLAVIALVALWRAGERRRAGVTAGTLAAAGVTFLAVHRLVYGGWTAYASGDHFTASGELGAVGFAPDYVGRSVRLVGLLVDRDFGLVAWQPAWLLVVPAMAALVRLRPAGWTALAAPLVAGWLTATFVALTMHGFWWPGRQVVVVLPLAVLAVVVWLASLRGTARRAARSLGAVLALAGLATTAWLLVAGWAGSLTWVGAPDSAAPTLLDVLRTALPDYRAGDPTTWALHAAWTVAVAVLALLGWRTARPAPATSDRLDATGPGTHGPLTDDRLQPVP